MSKRKKTTTPDVNELYKKLKSLEKQIIALQNEPIDDDRFVHFLVGGRTYFTLLRSTIDRYPESMLYAMVNTSMMSTGSMVNGAYVIDYSPVRFEYIVDYMRTSQIPAMPKSAQLNFRQDCEYFQLPFVQPLNEKEQECKYIVDEWLQSLEQYAQEQMDESQPIFSDTDLVLHQHVPDFWKKFVGSQYSMHLVYSKYSKYASSNGYAKFSDSIFYKVMRHIGFIIQDRKISGFSYTDLSLFVESHEKHTFNVVNYIYLPYRQLKNIDVESANLFLSVINDQCLDITDEYLTVKFQNSIIYNFKNDTDESKMLHYAARNMDGPDQEIIEKVKTEWETHGTIELIKSVFSS